jgi:hypothetical protein
MGMASAGASVHPGCVKFVRKVPPNGFNRHGTVARRLSGRDAHECDIAGQMDAVIRRPGPLLPPVVDHLNQADLQERPCASFHLAMSALKSAMS